ncbi:MAG: hypothetical protein WC663_00750 [Patescibacteria group bacterium]|jgi:hypothetical protein
MDRDKTAIDQEALQWLRQKENSRKVIIVIDDFSLRVLQKAVSPLSVLISAN